MWKKLPKFSAQSPSQNGSTNMLTFIGCAKTTHRRRWQNETCISHPLLLGEKHSAEFEAISWSNRVALAQKTSRPILPSHRQSDAKWSRSVCSSARKAAWCRLVGPTQSQLRCMPYTFCISSIVPSPPKQSQNMLCKICCSTWAHSGQLVQPLQPERFGSSSVASVLSCLWAINTRQSLHP